MFSSCLLFVLHIGTNKKISTCRYHKNTIKCNRLQLPCGQGTNRMFEWAVWVGTANESKGGWLFGPVTCQQIQHHMFYCEKPEVYHFCLFSHASAQQHEPWSICPSPHALIWQLHPIMVRKGGSGGEAFSTVLARWRMCVEGWLSCDLAGGPSDLQLRKCFSVCVCVFQI